VANARPDLDPGEASSRESIAREKQRLRASLLPTLRSIPAERARRAGSDVASRLQASAIWEACTEVVLFASLPGEVDTLPIFEAARRAGRRTLLPRMQPGGNLEFVPFDDFERLAAGRYGVREPAPVTPARVPCDGTLLLTPGVAFDRGGGRLGRGAGYYDRALAGLVRAGAGPILMGVAFSIQIVEQVPMGPHDIFLDGVVTDENLWLATGPRSGNPRDGRETGN
jgi:5-formyltetrahydrofolate cyclo-ligase